MNGLELSKAYYLEFGVPMLERDFPSLVGQIAAGLAGSGSECFGFDDEISRDHDFEPGFCLFLPGEDRIDRRSAFLLERAYAKLPKEYMGFRRSMLNPAGGARHGVIRIEDFLRARIGNPEGTLTAYDWLTIPEQYLAECVNGELFRDDSGAFTALRRRLAVFPEDIRLKKLAGCLMLMSQSGQYNFPRCLAHGEPAAAQLALFEFVRNALHTAFLLENRYMPFYKWQFRALRQSARFSELAPLLEFLITAPNDGDSGENKRWILEEILSTLLASLMEQELSDASCLEAEKHAQSVNDRIRDPNLRNMNLLAGVSSI